VNAIAGSTVAADRRSAFRFIICLGIVSLFADMTYEGADAIRGPYLKSLGATAFQVGFISGLGEMLAASLRFFSGRLADRTHAYWAIAILGYSLNVIAIPALAWAGSWQVATLLIVLERTGKALRGPARDVLLSEATGAVGHGTGFGLHAAMDQIGAVVGPLLMALALTRVTGYGPAFLLLGIPAVLALGAILLAWTFRHVPQTPPTPKPPQPLTNVFWWYVVASGLLACGFADWGLLSFHFVDQAGMFAPQYVPLLYSLAMGVVGLTAFVCGRLFDRFGLNVLAIGILITMLALPLGFLGGVTGAILASLCWAAGHGVQDASLRAGIAQVVSMNKRGTAFGTFNAVYGVMWFFGSLAMGWLYDQSLTMLVVFGLTMQVAAAAIFFRLRGPLRAAAAWEHP
jgi:MFS family permease